jgi:hypothetical protein
VRAPACCAFGAALHLLYVCSSLMFRLQKTAIGRNAFTHTTCTPQVERLPPALWNLDRIDQVDPPLDRQYFYGAPGAVGTGHVGVWLTLHGWLLRHSMMMTADARRRTYRPQAQRSIAQQRCICDLVVPAVVLVRMPVQASMSPSMCLDVSPRTTCVALHACSCLRGSPSMRLTRAPPPATRSSCAGMAVGHGHHMGGWDAGQGE